MRVFLGAMAILAGLGAAPAPARAGAESSLVCGSIIPIAREMLKRHVVQRKIDRPIRKRIAELYTKRIDPGRTLLLESDAEWIRSRFSKIFGRIVRGDCGGLDRLHKFRRKRMSHIEEYARSRLSREDWAIDRSASFVTDPEKRGYPKTSRERDAIYAKLIQFRIANLVKSGVALDKAKKNVIRHYERLTRRVRELDSGDVYAVLLDAIAKSLDPHSAYLSVDQLEDFRISSTLSLEGIGARLRSRDGFTVVEQVMPGAPADRQGQLRPKDKVVGVAQDGEDTVGVIDWSVRDVARLIRGPKGTKVHLSVLREGETVENLRISIIRDKVDLKQRAAKIQYHSLKRGGETLKLAMIQLPSFYGNSRDPNSRQTSEDVARLLREAREKGARGVLLDLSRNAGGLLDQAIKLAGLFLDGGGVVQVRDTQKGDRILRDKDPGLEWDGPLAVLTSRRSASASEIVAGALKDYDRAVIVGDGTTHGKGTMQTVSRLKTGYGALKVTTGFFFRPNGHSNQNIGIESDVVIPAVFNTDGLGEGKRPYTLANQTIDPLPDRPEGAGPRPWKRVTPERIARLVERSKARVAKSKRFSKVAKTIKAQRERARESIVRIAELLKDSAKGASAKKPAEKKADKPAGDKPKKKLPVFQLEALEILADHVSLGG